MRQRRIDVRCDAFCRELTGRFRDNRPGYAALAISDASHLSCVGNDYGYQQVFARFIEAHGRAGDVLLAISTSGTSKNVLAAVDTARQRGMKVIGLTGRERTPLAESADIAIVTAAGQYADRVQELHIKVIHILIELSSASSRRELRNAQARGFTSILIIGAGPIVIGQACEFDYSGAQACKALKTRATESFSSTAIRRRS